jgi:prephenate dehydratase
MIKGKTVRNCVPIADKRAAYIYGLEVLSPEIRASVTNLTKFVAIFRQRPEPAQRKKTSLVSCY